GGFRRRHVRKRTQYCSITYNNSAPKNGNACKSRRGIPKFMIMNPYESISSIRVTAALTVVLPTEGCQPGPATDSGSLVKPDPDNGNIELPDGFGALVVADSIGRARHLTVRENGDIYVAIENMKKGGGIA